MASKIKKGDYVIVLAGKNKGGKGEVLKMLPERQRVIVAGINKVKRHVRPSQQDPEGGIQTFEAPVHISNVAHIDPKDGGATRVGFTFLKDGKKVRLARKSGEVIDD